MCNYDIIIIGGGASGLCTAINAKKDTNKILIIDKDSLYGRKILSTGNGKCNLTNEYCEVPLFYRNPEGIYPYFTEGGRDFVETVTGSFGAKDTIAFFNGLGLLTVNKNGYIYPRTQQAQTVLDVLKNKVSELKIDVLSGYKIRMISKKSGLFSVDGKYSAPNLVLASGGLSNPKDNADGFGYETAAGFGHELIRPRPALCGLACKGAVFREIAGVRCDCSVRVCNDSKTVIKSFGNVQFTKYGISGIPVFQVSSEAGRLLAQGESPVVKIDPLSDFSSDELYGIIKDRKDNFLLGILNSSLARACELTLASSGIGPSGPEYKKRLCIAAKNFYFIPESTMQFKNSQVTAGGAATWQIDPYTMESLICQGLYFTGEIIDVNGICGGYNLQWAWSSGHVCGLALREKT